MSETKTNDNTPSPQLAPLAFTVKQTADLLNISTVSVYRLLDRGLLKSSKALRHKLIPRASINAFLKITD